MASKKGEAELNFDTITFFCEAGIFRVDERLNMK